MGNAKGKPVPKNAKRKWDSKGVHAEKTSSRKRKTVSRSKKAKIVKSDVEGNREETCDEFLSSEGCDPKFRRKLLELYEKRGISLIVLEPGVFDKGVKRFGKKKDGYAVVYDYEKTAYALAKSYLESHLGDKDYSMDDAITDAYGWLDFNTLRAIPYMSGGPGTPPVVVYTDEDGKEQTA